MTPEQRAERLRALADQIERRQLGGPARLMLDALAPLAVITSQTALFLQPLAPLSRWRGYLAALSDEPGWEELRALLDRPESR